MLAKALSGIDKAAGGAWRSHLVVVVVGFEVSLGNLQVPAIISLTGFCPAEPDDDDDNNGSGSPERSQGEAGGKRS